MSNYKHKMGEKNLKNPISPNKNAPHPLFKKGKKKILLKIPFFLFFRYEIKTPPWCFV